jgi:hypothetical protein
MIAPWRNIRTVASLVYPVPTQYLIASSFFLHLHSHGWQRNVIFPLLELSWGLLTYRL